MKHENVNNARISILEEVNIGALIENISPLTMQGTSIKRNLSESLGSGKLSSLYAVSTAIYETSTVQNVDEQLAKFVYEASNALNEHGIKCSLVYAFECIEATNSTEITERALVVLDELLALNEDQIKSSIRAGKLNAFRTIKVISHVVESTNIITNDVVETANISMKHPVSYCESTDAGVYFRSGSKVFCMSDKGIVESSSPSNKFTYISGIVEALQFVDGTFKYEHADLGSFEVSEAGIKRKNTEGVYESISVENFGRKMGLVIESLSFGPGISGRKITQEHTATCDALLAISENFRSIVKLDVVFEAVNKSTNERALFVSNKDNFHVAIVESIRQPKIVESFTDVRDAIRVFESKIGYDLSSQLAENIAEACSDDTRKSEEITERKKIIDGLCERRDDLITVIDETYDVPENKNVLIELQETLKIVEQTIVEQTTELNNFVK